MLIESLMLQYEEALYEAILACEDALLLARWRYPEEELAQLAQVRLNVLEAL